MLQSFAKFFIDPVLFIWAGLFFLLLQSKRGKSKSIVLINLFFFLISINALTGALPHFWRVQDTYNKNTTYDAVVILTGVTQIQKSNSTSKTHLFRFNQNVNRLLAGIEFVQSEHAKRLLFGNWTTNEYQEGPVIRDFALSQGLQNEEIIMYGTIERTLDEVTGVKKYAEEHTIKKILLVTSESHMRRARAMFTKQGIIPDTYSVNKTNYSAQFSDFIPSLEGLRQLHHFLYEGVGYVGYFVRGDL